MTAILTRPDTAELADDTTQVGSVTSEFPPLDQMHMDRTAGFGQFTARVTTNGENSYRFQLRDAGELVAIFHSSGEIAMAIYLSGHPVHRNLPTERIAELVVAGIDQNGYRRVVDQAGRWQQCGNLKRHEVCTGLAWRLSSITEDPRAYPAFPQWQPDWRQVVR